MRQVEHRCPEVAARDTGATGSAQQVVDHAHHAGFSVGAGHTDCQRRDVRIPCQSKRELIDVAAHWNPCCRRRSQLRVRGHDARTGHDSGKGRRQLPYGKSRFGGGGTAVRSIVPHYDCLARGHEGAGRAGPGAAEAENAGRNFRHCRHRSFSVARPASAQIAAMIQNRTTTVASGHPFCSK